MLALAISLVGVFGTFQLAGDHQCAVAANTTSLNTKKVDSKANFKISQAYSFTPAYNGSGTTVGSASGKWTTGELSNSLGSSKSAWVIDGATWNKNKTSWVKFTNVGWYNGKSIDLTITISAFGITQSGYVAKVSKVFNGPRTALESTGDVRWKFSYTYSGTSTAVSGMKSHLYFYCLTYSTGGSQEKVNVLNGTGQNEALQAVGYGSALTQETDKDKSGRYTECNYYVAKQTSTKVNEAWTNSVIALYSGSSYSFATGAGTLLELGNGDTAVESQNFYFTKTNESGAALSGATFRLTGSSYDKSVTSNANGLVNFGTLSTGTYTLTETAAASGYARLTGSWTVTVSINSETAIPPTVTTRVTTASGSVNFSGTGVGSYKLANYPLVPFSFTKTDSGGGALAGATFVLKNGSTTVATVTSGEDGKVDFGSLEAGTYTLTESAAPAGYEAIGGSWTVTVTSTSSGKNVVVTAVDGAGAFTGSFAAGFKLANTPKTTPFSFTKVDADDVATTLAGAVFNLKGASGSAEAVAVNKDATSTTAGLVDFGQLYHGSYTLTETTAPKGYEKIEGSWTVAVDADAGTVEVTAGDGVRAFTGTQETGYKLTNSLSPTVPFSFTKTAEDAATPLAGATFELYACGNSAHTSAADHSWTATNDTDCCWDVATPLLTATTLADGKANFGDIETGQYMLVETAAPSGYRLPHGQWLVDADAASQTVTIAAHAEKDASGNIVGDLPPAFKKDTETGAYSVANYKEWVMPLAGGTGTIAFTAAGAALVAAACAWYLVGRRRSSSARR